MKNLVMLHGGSVLARSEGLGKGSEFVIRLPVAPNLSFTQPVAPTPPASDLDSQAASRRVLVVDDNVDAAELLGDMLRRAGHEVSVVNDPLEALRALAEFKPDVAVLDIGLPVMDGYELAVRFRRTSGCRLVALTGYGQDHDRLRSREAGFDSHLVKPVDSQRLLRIVSGPATAK